MNIPEMKGLCPHCGKEMKGYMETQFDFGSPIQTCKKCKGTYLDRRYHEIEIDGVGNAAEMSGKRAKFLAVFGLIFFGVALLLNLGMVLSVGRYSVRGVMIMLLGLIMMVGGLIEGIMVKTGVKERQLEKKRLESQRRLENPEYARTLAELGYLVPEKYL